MLKESLEKENVAILSKAVELKKNRIKISVGVNNFEVVIFCQGSFNEVASQKSDCNGFGE